MMTRRSRWTAAAGALALWFVTAPAWADDAPTAPRAVDEVAAQEAAAKLAEVLADLDAMKKAMNAAVEKAENERERMALYFKMKPDEVAFSRRMIEVASIAPKSPAARDALLWVIDHPGMLEQGVFGEEHARAAARLVRDFGDDPEAVRIAVGLDNLASPQRDALLLGFLASAKGREAKGLARLALGQYLLTKEKMARWAHERPGRQTFTHEDVVGVDGTRSDITVEESDEEFAYRLHLRQCDPDVLHAEAERLLKEVIADYGDVPCISHRTRVLMALLKNPSPEWNGKPISAEDLAKVRARLARVKTLGEVAEGHLEEMRSLVVGKPAPEIDGVDFDGKPLKLSDHRGKVVALVFWGTWCGPCMKEVPHERELVETYRGRPFALLGVDCNDSKETAAKVMKKEKMTWPNWHDGENGGGPIETLYHVRGFPTVFVIDAEGTIRATDAIGKGLDEIVEKLVGEAEEKASKK
jgi:thiol-disulfide isomerase/thioredoxin